MNAIKLNNDQNIRSKLIMKMTKETEQYSNAKIRMLPKPSPKNIRKKIVLSKICKGEASKNSVPYVK